MTRDDETRDLKGYLRRYADSALAKSKDGAYCCPLCGSGTGKHKTGALSLYDGDSKWKCQSCGAGGDIYDLIGAVDGIAGFTARKDRARELYGAGFVSFTKKEEAAAALSIADAERDTETDFTPFFEEARTHLEDAACLAYLSKRGISIETARFCGLGFCAEWRQPKAPCAVPTSPRLIIPTSLYSYLARDVRDDLTDAQARFAKSKAGKTRIFGFDDVYIFARKSAFIVEGEIDALSIIEAGGEAIALGSASNVNLFFTELADRRFSYPLILSLDNDEAGRKAEAELAEGLQKRGLPFIRFCVSSGLKDANDALCADRAAFFALVAEGERQASEMMRRDEALRKGDDDMKDIEIEVKANSEEKTDAEMKAKEQAEKQALLNMSVAARARGFSERTRKLKDERCISTGFAGLDDALRGGLYPGLYILGGGTSIGKTAFMLQMADAIASAECEAAQELEEQEKTRRGVLYFSLETSADELMARSVSRLSRQRNSEMPIEYRDILDGFRTAASKGAVYDDLMAIFQDCLREHEG